MNTNELLNEFLEGKEIELSGAMFKKEMLLNKPIMTVYNDKRKFLIAKSITNFKRFEKWEGMLGDNTIIQPLTARYLIINKKPIQLCNISTDVYDHQDNKIDTVESKGNTESEEKDERKE